MDNFANFSFFSLKIHKFKVVILYSFISNAEYLDVLEIYYFILLISKLLSFKSKFALIFKIIFKFLLSKNGVLLVVLFKRININMHFQRDDR